MSFYATIQGAISYRSEEDFKNAVNLLEKGGWMKNGRFVNADDETHASAENLTITIPLGLYRNLTHRFDDLLRNAKGIVVYTSSDGCFVGGIWIDGKFTDYDLEKWARENIDNEDREPPDPEDDFELYGDWINMVECKFHEKAAKEAVA